MRFRAMVYILLENLFLLSRADILLGREVAIHEPDEIRINEIITRINLHEPISIHS